MKFLKKLNITVVVFCVCCIAFVAFLAYNPSHAYFQVHKDAYGINTTKVDLLFDKYSTTSEGDDESVFAIYAREQAANTPAEDRVYKGPALDQSATWGTEANPYIIRKKNHINNLAMLQKAGYFEQKEGQSFFVVCDLYGKPVAINCSEDSEMEIAPIGTPNNPFTGNISGAYIAGEATYENYKVTQSTIANLKIVATSESPDVGFFGRLGYKGTRVETITQEDSGSKDENGDPIYIETKTITIENGYSANISNLILADITISVSETITSSLEAWWESFGTRTVKKDGTDVTEQIDKFRTDCEETHHVGILAGHVDFGKISDISIYYSSDSVAAFDFKEANNSNTNFYSITGIIGTAEYVNPTNPTDTEGNPQVNILSSEGAITDEDLLNVVSGGGGDESGTLTGYMWAKNIFSRHEAYLDANDGEKANSYNVTELKTESGDSLFKKVLMREGSWATRKYKHYYYFADSIFTFAMSMSTDTNEQGTTQGTPDPNASDYIIKIWDCDEESTWDSTTPPPVTIVATDAAGNDSWEYRLDDSIEIYAHELQRVTSGTLSPDSKYVLAYITSNGTIYTLDLSNDSGYVKPLIAWSGTIAKEDSDGNITEQLVTTEGTGAQISKLYALSGSATDSGYSFIYNYNNSAGKTFSSGIGTDNYRNFGIKTTASDMAGILGGNFGPAEINTETQNSNTTSRSATAYYYTWSMSYANNTYQASMTPNFISAYIAERNYFRIKLAFNTTSNTFTILQARSTSGTPADTDIDTAGHEVSFALFEVVASYKTKDAMNMLPPSDTSGYTFNPSTDVLFYDKTTTDAKNNGNNYYSVEPLLSKQWLSGKPEYLSSLNHAVKLYRAATENYQLRISETFLGQWVGGFFDSNNGGVMEVPIGIDKKGYTIPAGTIAFAINEASEEKPSYINIVVAVNPELTYSSSIGLYDMNQNNTWSSEFSLANPAQSFPLPVSKKVTDASDAKYATYISNYTTSNGSGGWTTHPGTYTTHLRGEIVLVGYSFSVTSPGIYLIGSGTGPMTVAYFSVDGAAGSGGDGTGGTPLGNIDFVYSNTAGTVISVDHKFSGNHVLAEEDVESYYYPSYYYVRMFPEIEKTVGDVTTDAITIPWQSISIHRYVDTSTEYANLTRGRRRWIKVTADNPDGTSAIGLMYIFEDNLVGEDYS